MIHAMLTEGIHVIRMVKQLKQTYLYHGRSSTLPKLQKFMQHDGASSIFGSVVFTRYTILEWIRRNENDQKTYGELFFMLCDDIQDMDLTTALKSLMTLFVEYLNHYTAENTKQVKSQLINWIPDNMQSDVLLSCKQNLAELKIHYIFNDYCVKKR